MAKSNTPAKSSTLDAHVMSAEAALHDRFGLGNYKRLLLMPSKAQAVKMAFVMSFCRQDQPLVSVWTRV